MATTLFLPTSAAEIRARGWEQPDIAEVRSLNYATGNEYALVKMADRSHFLIEGGPGGFSTVPEGTIRVVGHLHPWQLPPTGPSGYDRNALRAFVTVRRPEGQVSSYLMEHGTLRKFYVTGEGGTEMTVNRFLAMQPNPNTVTPPQR